MVKYLEYKPKTISIIKVFINFTFLTILINFIIFITAIPKILGITFLTLYIFFYIRNNLSTFIFSFYDEEMIVQRVMGPFNYTFQTIKYSEMISIESKKSKKIDYKYSISKEKMYIKFLKDNDEKIMSVDNYSELKSKIEEKINGN
jgi:hypothetical protein